MILHLYPAPQPQRHRPAQPLPPLRAQAANLLHSTRATLAAAVSGRPVLVSESILAERRAICAACPHLRPDDRCSKCGCFTLGRLSLKLRLAAVSCPDSPPRWRPILTPVA